MTMTVKVNGREIDVLDNVNADLLCVTCLQLMSGAVELECGHGLCEPCAKKIQQRSIGRSVGACCPKCFEKIDVNEMRPNKMIQRLVGSLRVLCAHASKGYEWSGELSNLKLHEDTCDKFPVLCRSGCGISCPRNMLRNHYKTCSKHMIHCMFKGVGCKAKFKRQDVEVHMSAAVNDHMILLLEDSKEKTKSINALRKKLKNATTGKK